jgi:quinoprotein glucose dehydrogenase
MPRWLLALPLFLATAAVAVPPDASKDKKADNPDAEQAAARVQTDPGLKVSLWAAEPLLKDPVCIGFDEQGKCYVVETARYGHGVPDTRSFMHWLDEDIGSRSVADRLAMYKKHKYGGFEKYPDQVRVVWDSTGSGKADKSEVFSTGYSRPEDGIAAGVLARKGNVFFANIPDLYRLKDTDGDNKADEKESLSTGYGVRAQFIGHDLHGLRMGPDGKLYFSIGDRGLNVTTKEGKHLFNPDSGAVLRCDPDGANLELVHVGLRNPQELAFDDFGNLFTYDNNSDSGDRARWVQIVEGGDSGWRCGYQYGTLMHHAGVPQGNRGPWNTEKIWHVPSAESTPPAYVVPALAHFGNGPAGLTHYPGVGLNDKYKDHFFACDFTANAGNSVIWAVSVKPKGASFEVAKPTPFVRNMVPTDCDFGPDGSLYISDWVGGWGLPNKGRIFKLTDPEAVKNPAVEEARKLLLPGELAKKTAAELAKLLGHSHQTVRLEAQNELAGRKGEGRSALATVAKGFDSRLAKLHAVWGLGQVARTDGVAAKELAALAKDADAEVRVQVARALGGLPADRANDALAKLLADGDVRVKAAAAAALGRTGNPSPAVVAELLAALKANDNRDVYLRQALVSALAKANDVAKAAQDSPAVRLGIVLALRLNRGEQLGEFVADPDPTVATEAARAIYDQHVEAAMPALAKLSDEAKLADAITYRALAANFYQGKPENVDRLAKFAARSTEADHLRVAALKLLADWPKPPKRDPITGCRLDRPERPAADAVAAVTPVVAKLFAGSDAVRTEAVAMVTKLGVPNVGGLLAGIVSDENRPTGVRVDALFALQALKAPELKDATAKALGSAFPKLRGAARVVNAKADPKTAEVVLPALLDNPAATVPEKQMALEVMGQLGGSEAIDAALAAWLDKYLDGKVPAELKLDVLEAAQARSTAKNVKLFAPLREKLQAVDKAARAGEKADPLSRSREVVSGGDAEKGRAIFLNNAAVYCQRCHRLDGQGGDVGPALNGIGAKQTRDYLLEAILTPSKAIAKGYESVILNTVDGKVIAGVLRTKDATGYTVVTPEGKVIVVPKDDVESEKPDKSAMPDDLHKKLSKRELRDVVEFLAGLKDEAKK